MAKSHKAAIKTKAMQTLRRIKSKSRMKRNKSSNEPTLPPRMATRFKEVDLQRNETKSLLNLAAEDDRIFMKRWVALGLFCMLTCSQCCIWNTWGPIAKSAMKAFPTWHKSSVALLTNWGCITYLTCCIPCCWFLNEKDLSVPIKVAAVLSTAATLLRCFSSRENVFTTMAHLAAILNGLSGVIIGPATALFSAVWFPIGERTTATGISSAFSQLGMAISYFLGSSMIDRPERDTKSIDDQTVTSLRMQIMTLMRTETIAECLILVGITSFLPKQSEILSLDSQKISSPMGIYESLKTIIKNKTMWRLCLSAACSQGMTWPWLTMITMAFGSVIAEDEGDKLGFWTVIFSCILSLFASKIMDIFQGHLKVTIFILLVASCTMFFCIILLVLKVLTFDKHILYVTVIIGVATSGSTPALFLELASEIAFPVSEAVVGGYMIFLTNIIGTLFYLMFYIPRMGGVWATCIVFVNLLLATILIATVKEEYNRTRRESRA